MDEAPLFLTEKAYDKYSSDLCELIWNNELVIDNKFVTRKWSYFLQIDVNGQIIATDILKNIINRRENKRGQFPLYLACRVGNLNTIKILLNSNSDMNMKQKCSVGNNTGANFLHGLFWCYDEKTPSKSSQIIYEIFKYFLDNFKVLIIELLQTPDFKGELPYNLIRSHIVYFRFPQRYSFNKKIFYNTNKEDIYNHFNDICLFTKNLNQIMTKPLPEDERAYLIRRLLISFKLSGTDIFYNEFKDFLPYEINGLQEFQKNIKEETPLEFIEEGLKNIFSNCPAYMLIHTILENEMNLSYLSSEYLNLKLFIENDKDYFSFINETDMEERWKRILYSFNQKI